MRRWLWVLAIACVLGCALGSAEARTAEETRAAAAVRCQRAVSAASARYAAARDKAVGKCVGGLVRCLLGRGGEKSCALRASTACSATYEKQATLDASLRDSIRKRCDTASMLDANAVGFSHVIDRCGVLPRVALDGVDEAIGCLTDEQICSGARAFVTSVPRTAELVRTAGALTSLPIGTSCVPDYASDATAIADPDAGRQVTPCVIAMLSAGQDDRAAWRGAFGKCLTALFACTQRDDGIDECRTRAAATCDGAFRKLPAVDPASVEVDAACADAKTPFAVLALVQGANVVALAATCRTVGIDALENIGDWRACVTRTAACEVGEATAYVFPRADELLATVGRSVRAPFCPGFVPVPTRTPTPTTTPTLTTTPTKTVTRTPTKTATAVPGPTATIGGPCEVGTAPYGLTTRPANTTCRLDGSPDQFPNLQVDRAFPALTFTNPVQLTHAPDGTDRLFVVEQGGRIRVFPNVDGTGSSQLFLDISAAVQTSVEEGLLSVAFHPDYATNGLFYVYYSALNPRRSVIARYQVSANPNAANAASGQVVLEIAQPPYENHKGGQLVFGADGMLYVSVGDGGSAGDTLNNAQDLGVLLGKILRIDVDHTDAGLQYAIPTDNPFVEVAGARGEIWARGMRNPWRMSFDRLTHALWAGDVGQNIYEEVDLIEPGHNYGWRRTEANACYDPSISCDDGTLTAPLASYSHTAGCSVTGGFVYRGTRLPELYGAYVYGDYCSGKLWALRWDGTTATVQPLATSGLSIAAFGEDRDGELYVVDVTAGTLHRLNRTAGAPTGTFPLTLSATGCFDDLATRHPAPGLLAYDVQSPLWSDGAGKRRFLALPDGTTIGYATTGAWSFPEGTILVKEFTLERERGNPASAQALETRFLVRRSGVWRGYTYQWNEAQTEAYLLDGAATETFSVGEPTGATSSHTHYFPSRSDCTRCHTAAAGGTLGLQTAQLNRPHAYAAVTDNQLRAWEHIGLFGSCLPARPSAVPQLADPSNASASLDARARSYLHANCAHCHRPGGPIPTAMDLRVETPLAQTGICNILPQLGNFGLPNARLILPGHAEESVLWLRAAMRGSAQMPPLATLIEDPTGSAVLEDWITALGPCP